MILFVADMHFGRGDRAEQRRVESDLIDCLSAYAPQVEALYLMGDVFDQYIEYPTLVPKGFVRFQGLLAAWTDRGIPVTYLVGNHDPWHGRYFEEEMGVRVLYDPVVESVDGTTLYLAHGDGEAPSERAYRRLRPVLRHPVPVWMYRSLLPGDAGYRLARWVNRRFGHQPPSEHMRHALRRHAREMLASSAADGAVLGHSHLPDLQRWHEGVYLNCGSWYMTRTFGRLDDQGLALLRWNGNCADIVDPEK